MLAVVPALLIAGCWGERAKAPDTLVDGSPALAPAFRLEGVSNFAILTRARAVRVGRLKPSSPTAECLRKRVADVASSGVAVERTGVYGESVTVLVSRGLHGCDATLGARAERRRWCGGAFGTLVAGALGDPRLDLGCTTVAGAPVGFAWIEPARGTRYVAVDQPGFTEIYVAVARLPVRVASPAEIDLERSSAIFGVSEHDARGRVVRRYSLETSVAG